MTQDYNTIRAFSGIIKKDKVISLKGEYPISHIRRELERNVGKFAEITIYIGDKKSKPRNYNKLHKAFTDVANNLIAQERLNKVLKEQIYKLQNNKKDDK